MARKRMTEKFPWLLPIRQGQRKLFFYAGMYLDRNKYAQTQKSKHLPYEIFKTSSLMLNQNSGFDMKYQFNKVHNLKLAAKKIDGLLIRPGEVFSFCYATRKADQAEPYRDGLSLVNGEIAGEYGGGLCQFSNLLYWMFLHTQLTVIERHGHEVEAIPPAEADYLAGVDATVAEGWLDLKVKNNTAHTYQIVIDFDAKNINGTILADSEKCFSYEIYNQTLRYVREGDKIIEKSVVNRRRTSSFTGQTEDEKLYDNTCIIDYPLPANIEITEGV